MLYDSEQRSQRGEYTDNPFVSSFCVLYVVRCAIWYHLYNLKNVKKTHGGVLLLVKLQQMVPNHAKHHIWGRSVSFLH